MSDAFTPEKRSWIMSRIRSKDTGPERLVRSRLHRMGYRFRLHRRKLPGHPDIVLPWHRKVIFVHGCFRHGHDCRRGARPATTREFWEEKIEGNRRRDRIAVEELRKLGWESFVVRQCRTRSLEDLRRALSALLGSAWFAPQPVGYTGGALLDIDSRRRRAVVYLAASGFDGPSPRVPLLCRTASR